VRARSTLATVVLALVLGACGVPSTGTTEVIDPTEIPYALVSPPAPTTPVTPSTGTSVPPVDAAQVYFLDPDLELAAAPVVTPGAPVPSRDDSVRAVLRRLVAGPEQDERGGGLQSALGPDVRLVLTAVDGGTAVVDAADLSQGQSADRLPLAVGQVVLSLTSVPGVDGVRLQHDGVDREVPLPGGELTSGTLAADDYASLSAVGSPSG